MNNNFVWVAFTMFWDYYISLADGKIYTSQADSFKPILCDFIPESAEYITEPVSYHNF